MSILGMCHNWPNAAMSPCCPSKLTHPPNFVAREPRGLCNIALPRPFCSHRSASCLRHLTFPPWISRSWIAPATTRSQASFLTLDEDPHSPPIPMCYHVGKLWSAFLSTAAHLSFLSRCHFPWRSTNIALDFSRDPLRHQTLIIHLAASTD